MKTEIAKTIDFLEEVIKENKEFLKKYNVNNKNSLGINKSVVSDLYNVNCKFNRNITKHINISV